MENDSDQSVLDESKLDFERPEFAGGRYCNPASFKAWTGLPSVGMILKWKVWERSNFPLPCNEELEWTLPIETPNFTKSTELSYTWLGHSTVVVQMEGAAFITDPVFANKTGKFGYGSVRYRPVPCRITDLPQIDFGVISHNHYDHLDEQAVRNLNDHFRDMHWYVPLGLGCYMTDFGAKSSNVHEMNWGEKETISVRCKNFDVWCVPAQHWSQRHWFDRHKTLWSGWVVHGPAKRFYFAGDTGYCEHEFAKIGRYLGPFDVSAIPIGCFKPRFIMSPQHVGPDLAVQIHKFARSKKSFGIHWGTYVIGTSEGYLEPKESLKEEAEKAGLRDDEFITIPHGSTWTEES